MNILFHGLKSIYHITGIYEYSNILANQLGHHITYIGFDQNELDITDKNLRIIHLNKNSCHRSKSFATFFRRFIQHYPQDIVHIFQYRGCCILPLFHLHQKKPVWIIDIRTIHVENKRGIVSGFWDGLIKDKLTYFESTFFNYTIALTAKIKKRMQPKLKQVPVIPLGVSDDKFNIIHRKFLREKVREEYSINEDDIVFLYSGSLSPSRNIRLLFIAVAEIMKALKHSSFFILGNVISDFNYNELNRVFREAGIFDRVYFKGLLPYPEIPKYYFASDIGLSYTPLNTPYAHQPPTKILEYMMSGVIPCSNATKATKAMIDDNINGILSKDNKSSIIKGLRRAVNMLPDRDHISKINHEKILPFTWENIVKNHLLPFYSEICHIPTDLVVEPRHPS